MKINRRKSIIALLLAPFGFKAAAETFQQMPLETKMGILPQYNEHVILFKRSSTFKSRDYAGTWKWTELTCPSTSPKGAGEIRSTIV